MMVLSQILNKPPYDKNRLETLISPIYTNLSKTKFCNLQYQQLSDSEFIVYGKDILLP